MNLNIKGNLKQKRGIHRLWLTKRFLFCFTVSTKIKKWKKKSKICKAHAVHILYFVFDFFKDTLSLIYFSTVNTTGFK